MQANFFTNQYRFNHGTLPRGRGGWVFEIEVQSAGQRDAIMKPECQGLVRVEQISAEKLQLWVKRSTTYTEAKAIIKLFLRTHFTVVDVTVCS